MRISKDPIPMWPYGLLFLFTAASQVRNPKEYDPLLNGLGGAPIICFPEFPSSQARPRASARRSEA